MANVEARHYEPPVFENGKLVTDLRAWLQSEKGQAVLLELAEQEAQ